MPICPLLVLAQTLIHSLHFWKLTFHTVHFTVSPFDASDIKTPFFPLLAQPDFGARGRGHVANLRAGDETCVLHLKVSGQEAETNLPRFVKQLKQSYASEELKTAQ